MSRYVPGGASSGPSNPFSQPAGARPFYSTGSTGGVYQPTASGGGSGVAGGISDGNDVQPGVVSINPLDPVETAKQAGAATQGLLDGLGTALFGPHTGVLTGGLTGAIADGTDPISGVGRFVGGIPGGVGDTLNNAAKAVGGTLERVPDPLAGLMGGHADLEAKYNDPAVQAWLNETDPTTGKPRRDALTGDKGLLGTGVFGTEDHYKAVALRKFAEAQNVKNPVLNPGKFETPGSLADTVTNILDVFNVANTAWQRTLTNANRVQQLEAVGSGDAAYTGFLGTGIAKGEDGLNPTEQLVYEKLKNGEWTNDQAKDFLVASGMSNHDAGVSLAASIFSPDVVAGFGSALFLRAAGKGAQVAAATERAGQIAEETTAALRVAEEAANAAKLTRAGKAAIAAGRTTKTIDRTAAALEDAQKAAKAAADAAESLKGEGRLARASHEFYQSRIVDTYLGRGAKLGRYLIDPLHAMDLHMPGNARMVDLYSDSLTKTLHNTMNPIEGAKNFDDLLALDKTGRLADEYAKALSTGMTNRGREGILTLHQASAVDRGLAGALQTADAAFKREDVIADAAKTMRERDLLKWLREDITRNIMRQDTHWTDAEHAVLAQKMEAMFGMRAAEDWAKMLPKMSKERKSLLDFAYYGWAEKVMKQAVSDAVGHPGIGTRPLTDLVLVSAKTLTRVGADSLLSQLTALGTKEKRALALIREWQDRYPELRYVTIDPANPGKGIRKFIRYVEDHKESFPMQVLDTELGDLPQDLQDLQTTLRGQYQLGFKPKDEFLWGIERSNEAGGGYIAKYAPWADHVADGGRGFRPGLQLPTNIAGMPLVGPAAKKMAKVADYIGAGSALVRQQVTGAQIHEVARQRFIGLAATHLGEAGISEHVASKWWDRLQEFTREHQGYSGPRGFGKGDLYKAIADEGLIPTTALNGATKVQPSDILHLVLEAYDGDMRMIGLTQKLSGRVKKMVSAMTGYETNFAGQIAEHAWPMLKFRYNPIFQLQEKVEPWVLNAQRGISSPFRTAKMSEADRHTEALLQRLSDGSLIRQADLDQAEWAAGMLNGKTMKGLWNTPGTRMNKIASRAGELMDVQGVKRIGALRTFRRGLGREMRSAWESSMPGVWDDMKATADAMAGHVLNEDDFAVQMLSENLLANDIVVKRLDMAGRASGLPRMEAEWANAIKPGEWYRPSHIGELKALDLDHVAKAMGSFGDGQQVSTMADLRRVIASADKPAAKIEEVSDFLRRVGADKDYIGRVENSLTFSWTGFWKEAEKRYNLTFAESKQLQDLMGGWAELRGMTPIDFMSQVFNPSIMDGTEGLIGSLDGPLGMLRQNKAGEIVGRGRSRLAAPAANTAKREDLVRQMSAVFSQHLDPSAKRALLMEFRPELLKSVKKGTVRLHMDEVKAMWDADAEGQLADRILGYMDGKYGEAPHDVITDASRGNESIRKGVDKYLRDHGVTPLDERRHYQIDEAHYQKVADEYGSLAETPYEKTGRRPTTKGLYAADTDLKPQPAGVDDRTYQAYQQFVNETRDQFDFMTKPKAQGGLGIKVTVAKGDPYTPDAAGRAAMQKDIAKGQLRVLGQSSDHPLMTNEQNVMFRAVHDVFGHSAEGFEFGPRGELNAAANHFKMYGPEARGPLLTETHGQTSYVNYSNDVIPGAEPPKPLDPTDPALDFEARHPFEVPKRQQAVGLGPDEPSPDFGSVTLSNDAGQTVEHTYTQRLGPGILRLPPDLQAHILQPVEDLLNQFPDLNIHHIDVVDFEQPLASLDDNVLTGLGTKKTSPFAVTFGADHDESVILINSKFADPQYWQEDWATLHNRNELMRQYDMFYKTDKATGKAVDLPRESAFGAAHNAVATDEQFTLQQVMRHEAGHAFDVARRPRLRGVQTALPGYEDYGAMMTRFEKEAGRLHLSEYGMSTGEEFAAELFAFATNPALDMAKLAKASPDLHAMVDEFQTYLKKVGEWKPPVAAEGAGMTVREANAAKRGTVYAPQKAGLLSQETIDEFARQFVGVGKHVESNPDVARVAQQFGKWSGKAVENGLLQGDNAVHAALIQDIAGIPTGAAAPYNYTEAIAHQAAVEAMQNKWEDAFRLQYFAQSRTMLERSINHPMFGLYPASYMWGKLMPEVVQFVAQRPFGIRTGVGLSASMHAQSQIALRREYDPEFDKLIESLGHSQAMSFLGYMLPTLPWDITASAPTWMKDIAAQGNAQSQALDQGITPDETSLVKPAQDVVGKLNPLETTIPWAGKAIDEANGANTPKEQLKAALEEAQKGQVTAEELQGPLYYVMQELRAELSK